MEDMQFNSLEFAAFFIIVFAIYWLIPHKYRWFLLLAASYFFYACSKLEYLFIIVGITGVSFVSTLMIEKQSEEKKRRMILVVAITVCLSVLLVFKYFNFVSDSIWTLINKNSESNYVLLKLILPVGISFYTFQAISYMVDVYRRDIGAERHVGYYALFVSFFPQLVAGPIERSNNLLPQLKEEHFFVYEDGSYGAKRFLVGLFKKVVIADYISGFITPVFENPYQYHGFSLMLVAVLFSVQIYCDFSGYSDMAIGTARLLGIRLCDNFKQPYFSQSLHEFWGRWHMSLSRWFKDYVYIPLGGNRVTKVKHYFNLFITFLLSGLWHGANWTYVIWGGLHGIGQIIETQTGFSRKANKGLIRLIRIFVVCISVGLLWIFFASKSVEDAWYIVTNMWSGGGITECLALLGIGGFAVAMIAFKLVALFLLDLEESRLGESYILGNCVKVVKWGVYLVMAAWVIFETPGAEMQTQFIYFQF